MQERGLPENIVRSLWSFRICRYFVVACAGAVLDLSLFAMLVHTGSMHYLWASVVSSVAATGANYVLSIRFVFNAGARFRRAMELFMVYAVSAAGLIWHQLILYLCVEDLRVHVLLGKCIALSSAFLWNYLMRRNFVFSSMVNPG